jgi:hypothetical protein
MRAERLDVAGHAGNQSATADGHEDGGEPIVRVPQDLGRNRPLSGHHERIVEGVDEDASRLGGDGSNSIPAASSSRQNASRFTTSKPM